MKKILVVEDDNVSARMLRDYLDAHGYATSLASTGPEGLSKFHAEIPDLLILDVALPLKNGLEVCFDVKRTAQGQATPVLVMSAVYRDADHVESYVKGDLRAQGYLAKPFELRALLERVRDLIGEA